MRCTASPRTPGRERAAGRDKVSHPAQCVDEKQPKDRLAGQAAEVEVQQAAGLKQHKATSWAATKLSVLPRRVHNHSAQSGV